MAKRNGKAKKKADPIAIEVRDICMLPTPDYLETYEASEWLASSAPDFVDVLRVATNPDSNGSGDPRCAAQLGRARMAGRDVSDEHPPRRARLRGPLRVPRRRTRTGRSSIEARAQDGAVAMFATELSYMMESGRKTREAEREATAWVAARIREARA
jgi:hypothetical protein